MSTIYEGDPQIYDVQCNHGHRYRVTVPPQYPILQLQECPQTCIYCGNAPLTRIQRVGPAPAATKAPEPNENE